MGQYYKAILLDDVKENIIGFIYPRDFGNGLKLMEHSWMKNDYVGFVERLLVNKPSVVVWAGDYADKEKDKEENLYHICNGVVPKITHNQDVENKYSHNFKTALSKRFKYLINYDKGVYIDKTKTPIDNDGWQVHPLPLLTAEGNGNGGGDFWGEDKNNLVGSWARNKIGVLTRKSDIPKGFYEIEFDLKE